MDEESFGVSNINLEIKIRQQALPYFSIYLSIYYFFLRLIAFKVFSTMSSTVKWNFCAR